MSSDCSATGLEVTLLCVLQQMIQPFTSGGQGMPFESFDPTIRIPHVWTDIGLVAQTSSLPPVPPPTPPAPPPRGAPKPSPILPPLPSTFPMGSSFVSPWTAGNSLPTFDPVQYKREKKKEGKEDKKIPLVPLSLSLECLYCGLTFVNYVMLQRHGFYGPHGDGYQATLKWTKFQGENNLASYNRLTKECTVQIVPKDNNGLYRVLANQLVMDAYGVNLGGHEDGFKETFCGQVQTRLAALLNKMCLDKLEQVAKDEDGKWYTHLVDKKIPWLNQVTFGDLYYYDNGEMNDVNLYIHVIQRLDAKQPGFLRTLDMLETILQRPIHVGRFKKTDGKDPAPDWVTTVEKVLTEGGISDSPFTGHHELDLYRSGSKAEVARFFRNGFCGNEKPKGPPIYLFYKGAQEFCNVFFQSKQAERGIIPLAQALYVEDLFKKDVLELNPLPQTYCKEFLFGV